MTDIIRASDVKRYILEKVRPGERVVVVCDTYVQATFLFDSFLFPQQGVKDVRRSTLTVSIRSRYVQFASKGHSELLYGQDALVVLVAPKEFIDLWETIGIVNATWNARHRSE